MWALAHMAPGLVRKQPMISKKRWVPEAAGSLPEGYSEGYKDFAFFETRGFRKQPEAFRKVYRKVTKIMLTAAGFRCFLFLLMGHMAGER